MAREFKGIRRIRYGHDLIYCGKDFYALVFRSPRRGANRESTLRKKAMGAGLSRLGVLGQSRRTEQIELN